MIYLANPCSSPAVVRAMTGGHLGLIDTPLQKNATDSRAVHAAGAAWCADNGCFSAQWTEATWWSWLTHPDQLAHTETCLFAVAPDIVGDAWRSHMRSYPWLAKIRALGYPVAYVIQNGADRHPIPWHDFDVMFIGGTVECPQHGPILKPIKTGWGSHQVFHCPTCLTKIHEWKLGPVVRHLAAEAKTRGKRVHMGRVNSDRRWKYAEAIGCDSVDGTYLTAAPDTNLPQLLSWTRNNDQPALFGASPTIRTERHAL